MKWRRAVALNDVHYGYRLGTEGIAYTIHVLRPPNNSHMLIAALFQGDVPPVDSAIQKARADGRSYGNFGTIREAKQFAERVSASA